MKEINIDTIVHDDDPIIRTRSEKVALPLNDEDRELLAAMFQYVKDSQDDELCKEKNLQPAVGIAAIQTGVPKAMIAVRAAVSEPEEEGEEPQIMEFALANPKIISKSRKMSALSTGEGCLSVPGVHEGYVPRPSRIRVRAYDLLTDQNIEFEAEGYPAIVLQHEIDHLSGKLFYDHINPNDPFDTMNDTLELI